MGHKRSAAPELGKVHHGPCPPGLSLGDHPLALGRAVVEFLDDEVALVDNPVETTVHRHVLAGLCRIAETGHQLIVTTVAGAVSSGPRISDLGRTSSNKVYAPVSHGQILDFDVNLGNKFICCQVIRIGISGVHGDDTVLFDVQQLLAAGEESENRCKQTCYYKYLFHTRGLLEGKVKTHGKCLGRRHVTHIDTHGGILDDIVSDTDILGIHTNVLGEAEPVVKRGENPQARDSNLVEDAGRDSVTEGNLLDLEERSVEEEHRGRIEELVSVSIGLRILCTRSLDAVGFGPQHGRLV